MNGEIQKRDELVAFEGRILFLTEDIELLKQQLAGQDIPYDPERPLINNISTDEITPAWVCYYYDETLGEFVNVGLRGNAVTRNSIKDGGFAVIVSGASKGCGSSRETAPYAEKCAGIQLVVARSIEKIYGQNSQNIGLLTTTDFGILERIIKGERIPLSEFTRGLDPVSADIVAYGGLFNYNKARLAGAVHPPTLETAQRPMNLVEKIIARHAVADAATGRLGVPAVQPGDALFIRTDLRFSHDYVTPMAEALFLGAFGKDARVVEPESVVAFRDHLTFLGQVMSDAHRKMGLLERADALATTQESFTTRQGIRLYGEVPEGGSEAICHNAVLEDLGLPGQVILGTDSHTCTAGALGCFAFGVGSTDMANAWFTRDVRVKVPEVVRFDLSGALRPGVTAKDLILHIMAMPYIKSGKGIGQVLEFAGPGLKSLNMDERATLTNMAVEAGGFTGIMDPDEITIDYICRMRDLRPEDVRPLLLQGDEDASYVARFAIELDSLSPMVATPGDPRNGVALDALLDQTPVKVDIAYGGSCTGGKMTDMDMYAEVLGAALKQGKKVHPDVQLFIQFGSQKIRRYAEEKGYIQLFQEAGARLVNPSCGACIKAGPGVSLNDKQVTISAINRNFPGRSGPGKVYLASPRVVAASAVAGQIADPASFVS